MQLYYIFIIVPSVLFSAEFAVKKKYQIIAGTDIKAAFLYNAFSPIAFLLIMLFMEKGKVEFAWFECILSLLWAVVFTAITYFSLKAFSLGSLSNYSLFLLGGGMVLPILYGAIWGGDSFGLFKILGIALILIAVFMQINVKEKTNKTILVCLFLLFLLNGFASIIAAVYQSDLFAFKKPSAIQFSILRSFMTIVLGGIGFYITGKEKRESEQSKILRLTYVKALPWAWIGGVANGVANLLLLFALMKLEPSLQYPIVTGGSIFLSAIMGLFFKEKGNVRMWVAVAIAVIGSIVIVL